jgi:hypothetical protein
MAQDEEMKRTLISDPTSILSALRPVAIPRRKRSAR